MAEELSDRDKAVLNCIFNPNLPLEEAAAPPEEEELRDVEELLPKEQKTKEMEIEGVRLAECGELQAALNLIDEAIKLAPNRPSLYNNRAHIFQYLGKFEEALNDVSKAISLCTIHHKKTLSLAHCQRGILYRKFEKIQLAREDFEISAKLGNSFARRQLVELNPYAAMCNQMLRQVMEKMK